MKKKLNIPSFSSEEEEQKFWEHIDLSKYYEAKDLVPVAFPDLKPTSQPISIRLPKYLIARVKEKANALNIPYQALIKQYINHGVTSL